MSAVLRVIDANANRAREALRCMEEAARFVLEDAPLTRDLKTLRHELAATMSATGRVGRVRGVGGVDDRIFSRDAAGDVGAPSSPAVGESADRDVLPRRSIADVARAAGSRLGEALRAIEEYAKLLGGERGNDGPTLAVRVERLRFRGYELERRLAVALVATQRRQWRVCVLLSQSLCPGGEWLSVACAAMAAGADCIQLREKEMEGGELLRRARVLVEAAQPHGASVIVNDRPDVALLSGAHGVHLGQGDLPCGEVRRLAGRQLLIGVSTSRLAEAEAALAAGADYCGVGPMFATTTKHKPVLAGPDNLREYVGWDGLPHLAIGGVTPENIDELIAAGVRGVAVSGCVCRADKPGEVVRALVGALRP